MMSIKEKLKFTLKIVKMNDKWKITNSEQHSSFPKMVKFKLKKNEQI